MAILFVGSEEIDFPILNAVSLVATANYYRPTYSRGALILEGWLETPVINDQTDLWLSLQAYRYGSSGGYSWIQFFRDGTEVFRIRGGVAVENKLEIYQNSTIMAAAGNTYPHALVTKTDVHYLSAVSGYVRIYVNSVLYLEYAGDTSSWGAVDCVRLLNPGTTCGISEVILADEDTRRLSVYTMKPTGAGNNTGWTGGTYADIDDLAIDAADVIYSDTANQEDTFTLPDLPAGIFGVKQVKISAWAGRDTTGPSKLAVGVRTGSANYYDTADTLDLGWGKYSNGWDLNPADSAAWEVEDINALELALKTET